MFEENEAKDDRERYIEELAAEYTRRELNEIAIGLGLDPDDYPNKMAMAEAVLEAREREEAPTEEAPLEYPVVEEVTKEVEKVSPDTVKGKIKAIDEKVAEINAYPPVFHQSVKEQMKENEEAVAAFNSGVQEQTNENQAAVAAFNTGIQEQMKENESALADFNSGVQEQIEENENFVKQFYG